MGYLAFTIVIKSYILNNVNVLIQEEVQFLEILGLLCGNVECSDEFGPEKRLGLILKESNGVDYEANEGNVDMYYMIIIL